jgi:hypothetical protein
MKSAQSVAGLVLAKAVDVMKFEERKSAVEQ